MRLSPFTRCVRRRRRKKSEEEEIGQGLRRVSSLIRSASEVAEEDRGRGEGGEKEEG